MGGADVDDEEERAADDCADPEDDDRGAGEGAGEGRGGDGVTAEEEGNTAEAELEVKLELLAELEEELCTMAAEDVHDAPVKHN